MRAWQRPRLGQEVTAGNFLEWQKTVTVGAIIDEGGFEAGLDAGDDTLVARGRRIQANMSRDRVESGPK